ncbi:MAG: LD-carboxypeptidase, partial [Rhizobiaceae bacterium]|nr:LD-carboxypeptidase [Rhizobiaceae bacterium]
MTCWPRTPETPACLTPGDRIAVVSPSWGGPSVFPHRFDAGIDFVARTFGLEVVEMEHVRAPAQWLATHPEARAGDLMTAFADISISAIVASIGGDDAIRLLPYLDLNVISKNPKVFVGYSDATVLHFACLKAGIGSFYGPTVMAGFAENGGMHEYSVSSVLSILFSGDVPGEISSNTNGWTDEVLDWADPSNQNRKRMLNPCEP